MGKIPLGFCSQYISRKSHGSVPKIPSSFGAVVRKTGSGVNYPPPSTCNTRVNGMLAFLVYQCMVTSGLLTATWWWAGKQTKSGTADASLYEVLRRNLPQPWQVQNQAPRCVNMTSLQPTWRSTADIPPKSSFQFPTKHSSSSDVSQDQVRAAISAITRTSGL